MWPFRTRNRDQPAASKAAEIETVMPGQLMPYPDQKTEVIPRLTRDMPDTKLIPLAGGPHLGDELVKASMDVIEERLGADDQNLADWKAERSAAADEAMVKLAAMNAAAAKLKRLPSDDPMLSVTHLPEAFWAISREEDHRVYLTSRGIKSALTQLGWTSDGEVWKGVVYWHPVTSDYVDRPA